MDLVNTLINVMTWVFKSLERKELFNYGIKTRKDENHKKKYSGYVDTIGSIGVLRFSTREK